MAEEKPEWQEIQKQAGLVPYKAPPPEVLKKLAEQRELGIPSKGRQSLAVGRTDIGSYSIHSRRSKESCHIRVVENLPEDKTHIVGVWTGDANLCELKKREVAKAIHRVRATELPKITAAVEKILSKYTTSRVLVHTVSYHIRDYLMVNLPCQERLITHNSDDRDTKLEEFKRALEPLVMISPSFDRGIDLPHESCRCVIICKVPYLNLADRQVSARMALPDGQRWYNLKAAQSIVQMSGRAVRSKDDQADTYILDRQFSNLLARTRHIIPKWWQDSIKKGEEL